MASIDVTLETIYNRLNDIAYTTDKQGNDLDKIKHKLFGDAPYAAEDTEGETKGYDGLIYKIDALLNEIEINLNRNNYRIMDIRNGIYSDNGPTIKASSPDEIDVKTTNRLRR